MQDRSVQQLGNYRLLHLLGSGGFADVYLAEHVYLKTQVAVKVLHTRLLEREAQKFLNEARTVAHLQHPHIVKVLEYGVQDTYAFLVMDYAPHGTLRERYPEGTPQPLATVLPVVKQMSSALQYAHDQQLVHRDVKPENMLVGRDQVIWLSDFGLAIVAHSTLSQSRQEAFGTIAYMAPEQIRGHPRPASDQYALAAVVYEWLCGSPPFDGDSAITLAFQHISEPPPSPRSRIDAISPAVEAILLQALAKDPHARFASIQDFAQALEDANLHRFILPSAPTISTNPTVERHSDPDPIPARRISRRAWLAAGAGGLGLLAAFGAGTAFKMQREVTLSSSIVPTPAPTSRSFTNPTNTPVPTSSLPTPTPFPGSILTYRGHSEVVYNVAWSPDGKLIASCDPHSLQVWNIFTGNHVMSTGVRTSGEEITGVAWSPDSKAIAFSTATGTVYTLGVPAGNMLMQHSHNNPPGFAGAARSLSLAWSSDGQYLVSAGLDKNNAVLVWNALTNTLHLSYKGHGTGPGFAQQSSHQAPATILRSLGGNGLASSSSGQGYVNPVVACSRDSRYAASGGDDAVVEVWDIATGATLSSFEGHNNQQFSFQSQQTRQTVLPAFQPLNPHSGGAPGQITGLSWSPDNAFVASCSADATVQISNVNSGTQIRTYQGHTGYVTSVSWSSDGQSIASAGNDATVQVWDARTATTTFTYNQHVGVVHMVAYSPDGRLLASCGEDGTVQVWKPTGK